MRLPGTGVDLHFNLAMIKLFYYFSVTYQKVGMVMPIGSPVHESLSTRCSSMFWKEWSGYHAVKSFDNCHEREYFAFRHAAGVIDVSPLFKYDVTGKDAGQFLSQIMVKDINKLKVGQVTYCCWCDEDGYVLDDGTVSRLEEDYYRVTAAEPFLAWFLKFKRNLQVEVSDVSTKYAALSIQGPNSRSILKEMTDIDMDNLRFFRVEKGTLATVDVWISRTGYTGDLGYEVWCLAENANQVYEDLFKIGAPWGIKACGLDALDVTRVEAGFIMNAVDYYSANQCLIDARKVTPYEIGLGWCVDLDRSFFVGQKALKKLKDHPRKVLIGLDIDWVELEKEFAKHDLPPEVCNQAWRDGKPLYNSMDEFIGFATSGTWSPALKKNLALAQVPPAYAKVGNKLKIELTVEYERRTITATVVKLPFFNPERKRKP